MFNLATIDILSPVITMLQIGLIINLALAIFNMIPIFPLDGSHILRALVPADMKIWLDGTRPYASIFLLILIFTPVLGYIIVPFIRIFARIFTGYSPF